MRGLEAAGTVIVLRFLPEAQKSGSRRRLPLTVRCSSLSPTRRQHF